MISPAPNGTGVEEEGAARRYSPLGPPPLVRLENVATQPPPELARWEPRILLPQGTNPWGTGASFPALGSAPLIHPGKPSAEGGQRLLPNRQEIGEATRSVASTPRAGSGQKHHAFHGPTLSRGRGTRPKSKAVVNPKGQA